MGFWADVRLIGAVESGICSLFYILKIKIIEYLQVDATLFQKNPSCVLINLQNEITT